MNTAQRKAIDALLLPVVSNYGRLLDDAPEIDIAGLCATEGIELPARLFKKLRDASEITDSEINKELLEALKYARRFLSEAEHDTVFVDAIITRAKGES